jgi:hypothetical protein
VSTQNDPKRITCPIATEHLRLFTRPGPKAEVYPQQSVQPATRHPYTWAQQAPRRLGTTRTRTDADGARLLTWTARKMAQFCILYNLRSPTPSWTALTIARGLLAIGTTKTIRPLSPFIKLQASCYPTGRSCRHWINAELPFLTPWRSGKDSPAGVSELLKGIRFSDVERARLLRHCQSALKWDPLSASKRGSDSLLMQFEGCLAL